MSLILQVGASKLVVSLVLAAVAWLVQRRFDRPDVSHLLWLLVIGTLIVPSLVAVPVRSLGALAPVTAAGVAGATATDDTMFFGALATGLIDHGTTWLIVLWLLGSACVLGWSLWHAIWFQASLRDASRTAPPELQRLASQIAHTLGLATVPAIHTTPAHLSPMVWWMGGPVRVLMPAALLHDMDTRELRCILAHELAHVRRRDHMVRWLEWLACVAFWWNPVAWWARGQLRAAEEFCCDALVVASCERDVRAYANSLVSVIAFLSEPPLVRAPAFASEADSGGGATLIEKRLKRIVGRGRDTAAHGWLGMVAKITVAAALPLGLVYCGPDRAVVEPDPSVFVAEVAGAQNPDPVVETPGEALNARMQDIGRDYPQYYNGIVRQMARCFRWRGDENLAATVYFVINRDGSASGVEILEGSGSVAFDIEAMGAARCAGSNNRLGSLPDALPFDELPIVFRIDRRSGRAGDLGQ